MLEPLRFASKPPLGLALTLAAALLLPFVLSGCLFPECTGDWECGSNSYCSSSSECVDGCQSDSHCMFGQYCSASGVCATSQDGPRCGDGVCSFGENCASDCQTSSGCGDGYCAPGEVCNNDCGAPICGDSLCSGTGDCASDCSRTLNVPYIPQLTQVWCWAATSEMLLTYHGFSGTQCAIASVWLNGDCCNGFGIPSHCVQAAPGMTAIQQVLAVGGLNSQLLPRYLSFDEIRAEIDAGRPVMIGYTGSFMGHVVLLTGYDAAGNIHIHDPAAGTFVVPYAWSGLYNGSGVWSQTLVNIRPF